jgi:hypothetical protein
VVEISGRRKRCLRFRERGGEIKAADRLSSLFGG